MYDGPPGSGGHAIESIPLSTAATGWASVRKDPAELPSAQLPTGLTPYRGGSTQAAGSVAPMANGGSTIQASDCQASQYSYATNGFVIDHFDFCQASYFQATYQTCGTFTCDVTGTASWRHTVVGRGYNGSRYVDFSHVLDQWVITGDAGPRTMTVNMTCQIALGADCTASMPAGLTDTFDGWAALSATYFRFDSSAAGAAGADLISSNNFQTTVDIGGGQQAAVGPNGFRCDSASYLAAGGGCIFNNVVELFPLSVNSNAQQEALHIYQAQYHPDSTVPVATAKSIPGSLESGQPLNRTYYNTSLIAANTAAAIATCQTYFPGYDTATLDCDEYPFKSTFQGASNGPSKYSARPIPSSDNRSGGGQLGAFYTFDRIIDEFDYFYVVITN